MNTIVPPTHPLVKKKVLAVLLGVSVRTIDTWVARRTIPYIAASPRLHLFDLEAVKTALKSKFGVEALVAPSAQ